MVKTCWGIIVGALGWLFGASLPFINILLVLIVIDTVFGVINARKNGGITSSGFRKITHKVIFYFGAIIAVNLVIGCLALAPSYLMVLIYALIGCETLSVLEHWRISGYMPDGVKRAVKSITGSIKDGIKAGESNE